MSARISQGPVEGLQRLLGFLASDPKNCALLGEAAASAFEARDFGQARDLLKRHAAIEPLPAQLLNLKGLVDLAQQNYQAASAAFEDLHARGESDPGLAFNLAWAKGMTGAYREALDVLDDRTLTVSPRAPSLKIHLMHHLGLYEEALACGEELAERFPEDQALMGALATLALDAEKPDLARHYGERAGKSAEGKAALGFLALGDDQSARSLELFDHAIATEPGNPRAWVGKGLSLLASGNTAEGSEAIDRGAELFGDHIGSWIASGWAHFAKGDYTRARASFDRALAIDPNFSESHGGIAVMEILDGRLEAAQRSCEIALRLDRKSFGGALAKTLLLEKSGQTEMARRVRDIAFATPVGPRGETLAQILVKMGRRPGR